MRDLGTIAFSEKLLILWVFRFRLQVVSTIMLSSDLLGVVTIKLDALIFIKYVLKYLSVQPVASRSP